MTKIKSSLEGLHSRMEGTEERNKALGDRRVKITQSEWRENALKRKLTEPQEPVRKSNIHVIRVLEGKVKVGGAGKVLEEIMAVETSHIWQET